MSPHERKCILGCSRGATLHRFPRDEEKKKLWLKIIKMENCPLKNMYICTRHFSKDVKGKTRITWNAVPNINLRRLSDDELSTEDDENDSNIIKKHSHKKELTKSSKKKMLMLPKTNKTVSLGNEIAHYDPLYTPSKRITSSSVIKHQVKIVKGKALKLSLDKKTIPTLEDMIIDDTKEETKKIKINSKRTGKFISKTAMPNASDKAEKLTIENKEVDLNNARQVNVVTSTFENKHKPTTLIALPSKRKSTPTTITLQKISRNTLSPIKIVKVRAMPAKIAIPTKSLKNSKSQSISVINEEYLLQSASSEENEEDLESFSDDEDNWVNYEQSPQSYLEDEDDSVEYYKLLKDEPLSYDEENTKDAVQSDLKKKRRQKCGIVERFTNNNTFCLTCCYCPTEFEMWDWEKFIEHLRNEHKFGTRRKTQRIEPIKTEDNSQAAITEIDVEAVKDETSEEVPLDDYKQREFISIHPIENAVQNDFNDLIKDDTIEDEQTAEAEYQDLEIFVENEFEENHNEDSDSWPIDVVEENDNVIEVLEEKHDNNDSNVNEYYDHIDQEEEDADNIEVETDDFNEDQEIVVIDENGEKVEDNSSVINFKQTDSETVFSFLHSILAHPLLWHARRGGTMLYDEEFEKFLKEFNQPMSPTNFRRSMEHLRYQYRRFTPLRPQGRLKLQNNSNLRQYFQILREIVALSKPLVHHCEHCPFYFFDKDRLLTHKFLKHKIGNLPFACSCGLRFAEESQKDEHEAMHKLNPRFICELCSATFVFNRLLRDHMNEHHPEMCEDPLPYKCSKCGAKFPTSKQRAHHMERHVLPRFTCEQCGQSYKTAFRYNIHLKSHKDQKDFVCEHCGKAFLEKRHLNGHRFRIHRDGGLQCQYCRTFFSCHESLDAHNQKFHPNGTNLDRMKKIRRYFNSKYNKREYKIKSARIYKCKHCNQYFERMWELVKHKRTTGHNLQLYHCPNCTATLSSAKTLIGHLQRIHKLTVSSYAQIKDLLTDDMRIDDIKMEEAEFIEEIEVQSDIEN